MKKNIIVLSMSTLGEKIYPYNFVYKENDKTGEKYYSQLEPISRMILEREGSLDKIIILATKSTQKEQEFILDPNGKNEKRTCSAIDFYKERMGLKNEEKMKIVDVEEKEFTPAISKVVETIRFLYAEKKPEDELKLWIDTQGGFRNITLVMNAIISLLKTDNIQPDGIYSVNFNSKAKLQPIIDQTETYKIFQFVSGINEFSRYGRAEQLEDYYDSVSPENTPKVIRKMKDITEAIQMCNMIEFENYLKDLRKLVKERDTSEKNLLNIFWKQIENDYGPLLEESCTGLDIVEWFYKKKFYQQAITYIESKLPREWVERGILSCKVSKSRLNDLKTYLNKEWAKDENMIIDGIGIQCFKWNSIKESGKDANEFDDRSKLKNARTDGYKTVKRKWSVRNSYYNKIEKKSKVIWSTISIKNGVNADTVMDMILLYKLLKNERNKFNHMSDKNDRADQLLLGKVIRLFIECGREVYGD